MFSVRFDDDGAEQDSIRSVDRIEDLNQAPSSPWRVPAQVRRGYLLALLPAVGAQVLGMRAGSRLGIALDGRLGLAEGCLLYTSPSPRDP